MALRIRKDGKVLCAALNEAQPGDSYLDDQVHYLLSCVHKVLVTTENEHHMATGGQWWWKGQEPANLKINSFYYS